jgi:hypothetical protein
MLWANLIPTASETGRFNCFSGIASSLVCLIYPVYHHCLTFDLFYAGDTPSHFSMLKGPSDVTSLVRKLKAAEDITLLCINDDITREEARVSRMLQSWFSDTWSTPAAWEK